MIGDAVKTPSRTRLPFLTMDGDITMGDAKNIILNTGTGTKIGTATNQRMGFYNATPVIQRSAYTQNYSTADKTHASLTVGSDIAAFTDPPTTAEMGTLRTFVNALKVDHADLAQVVNALIDDLQALGLVA